MHIEAMFLLSMPSSHPSDYQAPTGLSPVRRDLREEPTDTMLSVSQPAATSRRARPKLAVKTSLPPMLPSKTQVASFTLQSDVVSRQRCYVVLVNCAILTLDCMIGQCDCYQYIRQYIRCAPTNSFVRLPAAVRVSPGASQPLCSE